MAIEKSPTHLQDEMRALLYDYGLTECLYALGSVCYAEAIRYDQIAPQIRDSYFQIAQSLQLVEVLAYKLTF